MEEGWKKERREKEKRKKKKKDDFISSLKSIDKRRIVGVDPGKHNIVYMTNESSPKDEFHSESKTLVYTSRQRRYEANSTTRNKILERKKPKKVQELEDKLSATNSCSPNLKQFGEYISTRFKVQKELYQYYANPQFRIF